MSDPGRMPASAGAEPEPGVLRTLLLALAVCGVCAALLTGSVVALRPLQLENQRRELDRRIRELVAGLPGVDQLVSEAGQVQLELQVVELGTGAVEASIDGEALLRGDGAAGEGADLPAERDPAGVGHLPRFAPIYLLRREGAIHTVILPVRGRGYLGTMRGYLAVAADGNTVRGITFTEHEETPGLGAEIASETWRERWRGKRLRDDADRIRIRVVQAPSAGAERAAHEVQGISGATKTGDGVTQLVRFWAGPEAFGPYLARLARGESP